ncbi:hypothetical protein OESDEN_24275 [Oesophagostomum dentatum]|uniref:Uncharacterized protein n=1 Tax=Oesophagostomum dentatum TaxID=61180 RepID=A0A0B1RWU1_OESDE|nr:hypothetical protein OESDEN_24275 [Oesophagostomum dentatum]
MHPERVLFQKGPLHIRLLGSLKEKTRVAAKRTARRTKMRRKQRWRLKLLQKAMPMIRKIMKKWKT